MLKLLCSLCVNCYKFMNMKFSKFVLLSFCSLLSKSEAEWNIGFHSYFCAGAVYMVSSNFV